MTEKNVRGLTKSSETLKWTQADALKELLLRVPASSCARRTARALASARVAASTSEPRPDAAQDFVCRDRNAWIAPHLAKSSVCDPRHDRLVNVGVDTFIDAHAFPQRGEKA